MRAERKDLSKISQIEWARLAAFIDGEGCIRIALAMHKDPKFEGARKNYEYVDMRISGTSALLMDWLSETFGGRVHTGRQNSAKWKPVFYWRVSCRVAVEMLRKCQPYLIIKREHAAIAIALQETMLYAGRRGTPEHVIKQRGEMRKSLRLLTTRGPEPKALVS